MNLGLVCCAQLLTLINDILDHTRLDVNKLQLEERRFGLRELIAESLDVASISAAEKGLELVCQIDPMTCSYVVGDSNRVRQILVNLLSVRPLSQRFSPLLAHLFFRFLVERDQVYAPGPRPPLRHLPADAVAWTQRRRNIPRRGRYTISLDCRGSFIMNVSENSSTDDIKHSPS